MRWLTAFIDRPQPTFSSATQFWLQVTSSTLSAMRGDHDEFATLIPGDGDTYLRVQRVVDGTGGCHLDVHVDEIEHTAHRAAQLGALERRELDDVIVMSSPAGMSFCVVGHRGESTRPSPISLDGGPRTAVDQICVDIPPADYEHECRFWAALTGWDRRPAMLPGYSYLQKPSAMPLRLLFQRLDDSTPGRRADAHLDLACEDVEATAALHRELGGRVHAIHHYWTTMTDPGGLPYCLTRRHPDTSPQPLVLLDV